MQLSAQPPAGGCRGSQRGCTNTKMQAGSVLPSRLDVLLLRPIKLAPCPVKASNLVGRTWTLSAAVVEEKAAQAVENSEQHLQHQVDSLMGRRGHRHLSSPWPTVHSSVTQLLELTWTEKLDGMYAAEPFSSTQLQAPGQDCRLATIVHGCAAQRGNMKPDMQDRHISIPDWLSHRTDLSVDESRVAHRVPCSLAGVFDGHSGSRSARYSATRLPRLIASNKQLWAALEGSTRPEGGPGSAAMCVATALSASFAQLEREILDEDRNKPPGEFDGSTALVGLQAGEHLFVANLGDSRAVLCREGLAVRLSRDHTPDLPEERKRIERVGGHVRQHRGVWRLILPLGPGCGLKICAVSRALGDIDYKEPRALMSAVPDVAHWTLKPAADRFVIYASDGVWGVMTDQQAVNCVAHALRMAEETEWAESLCSHEQCAELAAHALKVYAQERGSRDDITVVITMLDWAQQQQQQQQE